MTRVFDTDVSFVLTRCPRRLKAGERLEGLIDAQCTFDALRDAGLVSHKDPVRLLPEYRCTTRGDSSDSRTKKTKKKSGCFE
jgi:hypothetical protein